MISKLKEMFQKLISFFSFNSNNNFVQEIKSMESEIMKIKKEISCRTLETTVHWEEIEPFCGFKKKNKQHLLIADDNNGVVELVKEDMNFILEENNKEFPINKDNLEIVSITDSLAPYRIMKTCENEKEICNVDYAIIDIVFGDFVVKNGELLYMDGIDLVEYLIKINPNIKTCLFTGCYLSENSKEKQKIVEKLGEEYLLNNVLEKSPFMKDRIKFYKNYFVN